MPLVILWSLVVAVTALLAVEPADVELTEDEPTIPPPTPGNITGTISPAELIQSLSLVSRVTGESHEPAAFDADSGEFAFEDLPGDAAYDLIIETTDGRTFEGIDLSFVDARLLRMAATRREELGLPAEAERPFTQADADALVAFVDEVEGFMDTHRVLYVGGHGRRATVLLELMRTADFHADEGHVIWRVELWYFEYATGAWQAVANQARVIRRFRGPPADWQQLAVEFRPDLSVFIDAEGHSDVLAFEIPEGIFPPRGRPANSRPQLDTQPHILGIDDVIPSTIDDLPSDSD